MTVDGAPTLIDVDDGLSERVANRERLVHFRVSQAGLDAFDAKARQLDITRSTALRHAMRDWIRSGQ